MSEKAHLDPDDEHGSVSQGQYVPPPFVWRGHTEQQNRAFRRRQRSGARALALVLGALVLLIFFVTIAKIKHGG